MAKICALMQLDLEEFDVTLKWGIKSYFSEDLAPSLRDLFTGVREFLKEF